MKRILTWSLVTGLLAACGGGGGGSDGESPGAKADEVPAVAASGPGCVGVHGDPPRPFERSVQGQLASLYYVLPFCAFRGGEILRWTDPEGTPRQACLHQPANATATTPMPLVTFLPGSIFPGDPQTIVNALEIASRRGDLNGDPSRPGFNLLVIEGRDKEHFYPFPDNHALGFDNWYRNLDRRDADLNVDVATIDHFIDQVMSRDIVDERRNYLMGWSNGAAMAILYGLNTRGIAATAVYSSPDPFRDVADPCAQPPFGNNLRPIMTVHNRCDIIGICTTGSEGFGARMAMRMPQVEYRRVIIDGAQNEAASCDARCSYDGRPLDALTPGAAFHGRWPFQWTDDMLRFLRERPL